MIACGFLIAMLVFRVYLLQLLCLAPEHEKEPVPFT